LSQLEGLSPELVAILDQAGFGALNDVIVLEPEEIARIPGMTQGTADEPVRFLTELTEEAAEEKPAAGTAEGRGTRGAPGPARTGASLTARGGGSGCDSRGIAARRRAPGGDRLRCVGARGGEGGAVGEGSRSAGGVRSCRDDD